MISCPLSKAERADMLIKMKDEPFMKMDKAFKDKEVNKETIDQFEDEVSKFISPFVLNIWEKN